MGGASGDLSAWGDGVPATTISQDFESIAWTAGEIDELALIIDSAQASSANSSPSLVTFATPPDDTLALHPGITLIPSHTTTPSASHTTSSSSAASTPPEPRPDLKRKRDRERNTEAARRYRKRRVDETDDLRASLAAMTKERDNLRLQLVKAETEAQLLRKLVSENKSKS